MDNEESEIKDRIYDYQKAINNGDYEGWLSLWAEDGLQMPPNTSVKIGIDHIRGANKHLFKDLNLKCSDGDITLGPLNIFYHQLTYLGGPSTPIRAK